MERFICGELSLLALACARLEWVPLDCRLVPRWNGLLLRDMNVPLTAMDVYGCGRGWPCAVGVNPELRRWHFFEACGCGCSGCCCCGAGGCGSVGSVLCIHGGWGISTRYCGIGTGGELCDVWALWSALLMSPLLFDGGEPGLRSEPRPMELVGIVEERVMALAASLAVLSGESDTKGKTMRPLPCETEGDGLMGACRVLLSLDVVMFPAAMTRLR